MKAQYLCTTSQAKKVTVLVWLLASLLALPTAVARVHLPVQDGSKFYCILDWDRPWQTWPITCSIGCVLGATLSGMEFTPV